MLRTPSLRPLAAVALLAPLLLSSCLISQNRINQPLPAEAISGLKPGLSVSEVMELLGAPVQVVELDQRSAYRFEFERTKQTGLFLFLFNMNNQETASDRIWCFFSKEDRLTHFGATFEAGQVSYGLG